MTPWELLAEGRGRGPAGYLPLLKRTYRLPDGRISDWDLIGWPRTVAVLALTPGHDVVLARQYRPGPGLVLDELPGGVVEDDETPAEGALRELVEETGYSGSVSVVASTWLSAAAVTQRFAVVATDCRRISDPAPVGDEFCEPVLRTLAEFRAQLRAGGLTDTDLGYLALDHSGLL